MNRGSPASAAARWAWLGRVPFAETAALQERLRADILTGQGGDTLLLLEHAPVITMGRTAVAANVLVPEAALAARGIALHRASRGGDVTYHGPGQLVGYPVVRVRAGVRAHVQRMAAAVARVLAGLGVDARYRSDAPGLWIDRPHPAPATKICAFGIHVHRGVAVHGFALNLDPDLAAFHLIVPCGLAGSEVTSVRALLGAAPSPSALAPAIAVALSDALQIGFEHAREAQLNCNV